MWVQKCDVCGELYEMGIEASRRVKYGENDGQVLIEIVMGTNRVWNDGHICNKCLAKILRKIAEMLETNPEAIRK